MTYFEYFNQLVNEFLMKKADAQQLFEAQIRTGNLNRTKTDIYLERVNECLALADLAEGIMHDLLAGQVSPFEQID
jgi:hypothetical protein